MAYLENVPLSTDFISQSQVDFKGNNDEIQSVFGKPEEQEGDHIPLTHPKEDDRGKHRRLMLVDQTVAPTPLVNEAVLYAEKKSSVDELHYIRNGEASGNQITSNSKLVQGGLVLEAFALFDVTGKILERTVVDENGVEQKQSLSYNVSGITQNTAPVDGQYAADFIVNFATNITTANYIWQVSSFNRVTFAESGGIDFGAYMQPKNDATYSNTVAVNSIHIQGYRPTGSLPNFGDVLRIQLEVYTAV